MTAAEIRVLGSCGAWPEPGRACSGLLVSAAGFPVVVDLGYGAFSRLSAALDGAVDRVAAVVVTHAHPDHLVDVHALYRSRRFGGGTRPLPLLGPRDVLPALGRIDPEDPDGPEALFAPVILPGVAKLGPWRLTGVRTPHYLENVAIRLDGPAGAIVITGDTAPYPELADLARGAELLLCDATDRYQRQPDHPPDPMLMTAADAGRLAAAAGVGRLVLTHFWPGNDRERSRADAAAHFAGPIDLADENAAAPFTLG